MGGWLLCLWFACGLLSVAAVGFEIGAGRYDPKPESFGVVLFLFVLGPVGLALCIGSMIGEIWAKRRSPPQDPAA